MSKDFLTYAFASARSWQPSLDPEKSDTLWNLSVMQQVVGTLIQYGDAGEYLPYLAVEWKSSDENKIWTFQLRPGLKNQRGETIDAAAMRDSLLRSARRYSERQDPPLFSQLEGWDRWKSGEKQRGRVASLYRATHCNSALTHGCMVYWNGCLCPIMVF